jgi:hypothetical protein
MEEIEKFYNDSLIKLKEVEAQGGNARNSAPH